MRMNFLRVGLVSLTVAAFVGCGGEEPGQPLASKNTQKVLTQFSTMLGQLPKNNNAISMPTGTNLTLAATKPGVNALAATECETITPTTPVDADNDSIAATKTGTFDCTNKASGQVTYSRKGSYKVQDLDETVAGMLGGLRVDFNITGFKSTQTDGSISDGSYVGFWNYKGDGSGGMTSTSEYTGRYYYKGTTDREDADYTYSYTWNWKLTPDNSAATWTTGTQEFSGTFSMSGTFRNSDQSTTAVSGVWKTSYYSKNLKYDSTCTKFYRSGSVFIDDQNGNVMELRYGCSTISFYVNNVASDWYTPN